MEMDTFLHGPALVTVVIMIITLNIALCTAYDMKLVIPRLVKVISYGIQCGCAVHLYLLRVCPVPQHADVLLPDRAAQPVFSVPLRGGQLHAVPGAGLLVRHGHGWQRAALQVGLVVDGALLLAGLQL